MCTSATPYLFSSDSTKHVDWLKDIFEVEVGEIHYFKEDPKRVMHTCVSFQDGGKIMMSDYMPGENEKVSSNRGFATSLQFSEGNGQKYWKRAIENGGKVKMEYGMQFWGSYFGSFEDPFGFLWFVVEEPSKEKVENGST